LNQKSKVLEWYTCCSLLALAAVAFATGAAHADSELSLPYPTVFGKVPASTFDASQRRVGDADLEIEKLDDGTVRIYSESTVDGGARAIATAILAPTVDGTALRPITQGSRVFDLDGKALGVMTIDHRAGEGSCASPNEDGSGMSVERLSLPENDRIANVPLNLLFDPLVKGDASTVNFQIMLCRNGPQLVDFEARVVENKDGQEGNEHLVEVRYSPNLGSVVSLLAQAFVPRLSFWFDPSSPIPWLAHRMPLYADGPEVLVVRQGIPTTIFIE
jgi:hypothetical protein